MTSRATRRGDALSLAADGSLVGSRVPIPGTAETFMVVSLAGSLALLRDDDGRLLHTSADGRRVFAASGSPEISLRRVDLRNGTIALRDDLGRHLGVYVGERLTAAHSEIYPPSTFTPEPTAFGLFRLRTSQGSYLRVDPDDGTVIADCLTPSHWAECAFQM